MRNTLWTLLGVGVCLVIGSAIAQEKTPKAPYGLGRTATEGDLSRLDISVFPNGVGLPEGHGTPLQGKVIYQQLCAACHGENGEGTPEFVALVGGRGTLATPTPLLTIGSYWPYATSVFDYVRRAMPYATPGSLTNDQVYAVTAWLLYANGIVEEAADLNAQSLAAIRMPNRDGFVRDTRPDIKAKR
jgi:hypothetical protein